MSVAYGAGLRENQIIHLKAGGIDSEQLLILIKETKGRKDRHVMLSVMGLGKTWGSGGGPDNGYSVIIRVGLFIPAFYLGPGK